MPHLRALIISRSGAQPPPQPSPPAPGRCAAKFPHAPAKPPIAGFQPRPVSTHRKNSWSASPSLSPPSRCSRGSAPTSCRALGSGALSGVPRGRACSWLRPGPRGWQWAGAAGSLSLFRERLSNSRPRRRGTWQPLASCVPDPAGGHHSVSAPWLSPLPLSVHSADWQCLDSSRDPHPPGTPAQPPAGCGLPAAEEGLGLRWLLPGRPSQPRAGAREARARRHFLSFSPHPGNECERAG